MEINGWKKSINSRFAILKTDHLDFPACQQDFPMDGIQKY